MEVTVKRIVALNEGGSVKASCEVALGEQFLIKGVRVVEGKHGMFVSMPRQQTKAGQWVDRVEPLTPDAKEALSRVVLDAYRQHLAAV
jgi:stage V sporulation protein G